MGKARDVFGHGKGAETLEVKGVSDDDIAHLGRSFFVAVTKLSENAEDILPQEDSEEIRMSVFTAFAELFPESVGHDGSSGRNIFR